MNKEDEYIVQLAIARIKQDLKEFEILNKREEELKNNERK